MTEFSLDICIRNLCIRSVVFILLGGGVMNPLFEQAFLIVPGSITGSSVVVIVVDTTALV